MPVLEVKGLSLGFEGKLIIEGISFAIEKPSFVAIIGHNGCGKTTFFKSLIQSHPYKGEIFLFDQKVNGSQTSPRQIAILEQRNLVNFQIKVKDIVVMGLFRGKGFFENYTTLDYERVLEILEFLGRQDLYEKDFNHLSGGEQQLVWIAQMMIQEADVYLLDEPTQYLDLYYKKVLFDLMGDWVKRFNKTVFCITHDLYYLEKMDGYLLNFSQPDPKPQVLNNECLEKNIDLILKRKPNKIF
ncbi:MAG: ABC transporter ATP-binding protein [Sporocytophaga sp.]|uniref:ABC transporter ATP-binding protein n=1 Tax=Sporocytophaga sp. TaxID=2231183 RepID=UPI001B245CBE|nr:ABC transporter ATP-binding protein [Sporocytophaga sp.]MBO9699394.1 ABC transporter ATP-binding protein [Sporocytophaga sp.]